MRLHPAITDALRRIPRTRNTVVATGVGASLVLGSGVALAAGGDLFASDTAAKPSATAERQDHAKDAESSAAGKKADEQQDAERKAEERRDAARDKAAAEKKAEAREAAEKKAAAQKKAAQKKAAEKKAAEKKKQKQAEKRAEARKSGNKHHDKHKAGNGGKHKDSKKASRSKGRGKVRSWVLPVSHPYAKTAGFSDSGDRWAAKHSGQDFAVPTGTPVKAVHNGTVVTADWGGAYGNEIVVKHPNGTYTQYAHLSEFRAVPGEHVNTGEQIAVSGSTGNSTGPHLHFEVRTSPYYGSGFDPVPFLQKHGLKP
ncbi:M23 family metallopeptidase [Streptomyces sp. TR02-1]|uniref:M23 family metallopeptidase n=1 Tax=Streptomyces sp. TR02-1 TaxID=3385977 RepID=UPI0039A0C67E